MVVVDPVTVIPVTDWVLPVVAAVALILLAIATEPTVLLVMFTVVPPVTEIPWKLTPSEAVPAVVTPPIVLLAMLTEVPVPPVAR